MPPESSRRKPPQQILITDSFRRQLKKLRRHFHESDIVEDVRRFARSGLRRGEAELKSQTFGNVKISIVKLRLRARSAVGRYLLGILGQRDFVPLFIDLKTGAYGRNLSLDSNRKTASMLEAAIGRALVDYLDHSEDDPRLVLYPLEVPG